MLGARAYPAKYVANAASFVLVVLALLGKLIQQFTAADLGISPQVLNWIILAGLVAGAVSMVFFPPVVHPPNAERVDAELHYQALVAKRQKETR